MLAMDRKWWWWLAVVVLVAMGSRAMTFDRVFERDPEGCGAYYGQLARNYFRFSLISTAAVPINNLGDRNGSPRADLVFYPNHPPLLPLLIAGTYGICRWNPQALDAIPPDWQTRLSSTLFTIALAVSLFEILRRRGHLRAAILASILFSLTPMTLKFGSQPDCISPQLCCFILWTVIAYLRFAASPSIGRLIAAIALFFLAAATDWPAYYLLPVVCAHYAVTHHWRKWVWIIAFGLAGCAIFALFYGQAVFITHDWHWMGKLVERRTVDTTSDRGTRITFGSWIRQAIGRHAIGNHTWVVIGLMVGWIACALIRSLRDIVRDRALRWNAGSGATVIGLMLAWAALHVFIGRQGVFVHEWWWWPLTPAAAMAAAMALDCILQTKPLGRIPHAALCVLLAIGLVTFGWFNVSKVRRELSSAVLIGKGDLAYSLPEIGEAIRSAAPLNGCVMLAESDETLGLWFYADRPIKRFVWYPEKFEERMKDGWSDLPFGLYQKWQTPPVAMILPRTFAEDVPVLKKYLDERYKPTVQGKFIVYDLAFSGSSDTARDAILTPTDD